MRSISRLTLAAFAAPLLLALSACGSGEEAGGATGLAGEPIEPTPPPGDTSWLETAQVSELGGIVVGNPDAPLKLVKYASHTCPACAYFASESEAELNQLIERGIVSFEIRNQIHDPLDLTFAVLARCGEPATFQPLAKQGWAELGQISATATADPAALEAAAQADGPVRLQRIGEVTGLVDWFAARGVPRDRALQCLSDLPAAEGLVERSNAQSEDLGVTGTPTFFLNGDRLEAQQWSDVQSALQAAGAR